MRTMKTIMTGMSVATLAMVMACGISTTAGATGTATIDQSKQTMTVSGENTEVMVSFDAIKVVKNVVTWNEKAKWDIYDGTSATVDLSILNTAKDMYVAVKDNAADSVPNVYHIAPDTSKPAAKYEVADKASKLTITDNKVAWDSKVALEYRTERSNVWTAYKAETFPMNMYEQQGATLYFRKAAVKFSFAVDEAEEGAAYLMNEASAGNFAGKEFKVKVTKMANAPAATINYDAGTFTVKKGTEYRILNAGGEFTAPTDGEAGDFTPAGTDATTVVNIDVTKDGFFEVRTAADKKVASKIAAYAYKGVATPKASDVVNGVTSENAAKKGLNLTYSKDRRGNDQVTFNNANESVSYVIYKEDPAANAKAKPVATLKKAGEKGYKDATVAASKLPNDTTLYIMTASDKKNGVFRSQALKTIKIAYPAAEEEDPEA